MGAATYVQAQRSSRYLSGKRTRSDAMKTTKQSTFGATLRTTILLASLSGLLVVIGALIGGPSTAGLFLGIALLIHLGSHFFSDKLALKMSRAQPIDESEAPRLY